MPKRTSTIRKRNRDTNKAAFDAVQHIIALTEGVEERSEKNPAAVALGRLGGLKGGKARAETLSSRARQRIARKAALARWSKER